MESIWKIREEIVYWSRKVQEYGYVSATDGNLSMRIDENRVIITPSGVPKGEMTLDAPIIMDMEGNKLEGDGKPSSEGKLHIEVYRLRPDVDAVIHAHPPKCIAFTVAGIPIDTCLLPEVVVTIGAIPTSAYATPTTDEVPESIRPHIMKSDAVMLARHGSLTVGKCLKSAFKILEKMEHCATIAMYAKILGGPVPFTEEELKKLYDLRPSWGVRTEPLSCTDAGSCSVQPREKLSGAGLKTGTCSIYGGELDGGPYVSSGGNGSSGGRTADVDIERLVDVIVDRVKSRLASG
jgi:L-fuculose-phosphate aldolase